MNKTLLYVVGIPVIIAVLAFAYYAISPVFRVVEMNEPVPTATTAPAATTTTPQEQPGVAVTGTFGHPASGTVRIVEADGKRYVRYENYKTINGPDIYVYLAKDLDATEFVSLGKVKATEGNINYEIPDGVDLADYPYVVTWCKMFGVLFNYARVI